MDGGLEEEKYEKCFAPIFSLLSSLLFYLKHFDVVLSSSNSTHQFKIKGAMVMLAAGGRSQQQHAAAVNY
jgi:hypothetical protein